MTTLKPVETAWETAQLPVTPPQETANKTIFSSKWPIVIFLSALFGAPYITWKMLASSHVPEKDESGKSSKPLWSKGNFLHTLNKI